MIPLNKRAANSILPDAVVGKSRGENSEGLGIFFGEKWDKIENTI
jgi:hypothetical protein